MSNNITPPAPIRYGVKRMFQLSNDQTIVFFPLLMGSLTILLGLFSKQLLGLLKIKPMSEVFTTPSLQRSAKITEKLAQLFLVVLGTGFLVQGVGSHFLSSAVTASISITILGLSGVIILAAIGVVLAHWKAK
jgi:hypothetical protein